MTQEKASYSYKVYGLVVNSEIKFSELAIADRNTEADVTVRYGAVPKKISNASINNKYLQVSKNEMYFFIEDLAHFYISNGNLIIVEPLANYTVLRIKIYLLGGCLGTLLAQRNILGIHGGTILYGNKGIIITGRAGAGKSTLVAAYKSQGYLYMSDDISAIEEGSDKEPAIVHPSYPQQKLCEDALANFGLSIDDSDLIDSARKKYAVRSYHNFQGITVPLTAIYELCTSEGSTMCIDELYGAEKIKTIISNIYGIEILKLIGLEPDILKKCVVIAQKVRAFRVYRPISGFTVCKQIEIINKSLQ